MRKPLGGAQFKRYSGGTGKLTGTAAVGGNPRGMGANDKNSDFGMSVWFFTNGANGGTANPCGSGSVCDFNLKLTSVPVPAGIALLPAGLAVLAGMRMPRRKIA